jgi:glutaconate CoA-transferase, subunit A
MGEARAGAGRLFMDPDPEAARAHFREKKGGLVDKVMSVRQAVASFIHDGDYVCSGGFGTNRIATAVLHEILRQGRQNLGFAGFSTTHAFQVLAAGNRGGRRVITRVDAAYVVGLEARGLSPHGRRVMEGGGVEVCEWSNYALAGRLKAAAMGVPFIPTRSLQGTDTFEAGAARIIDCPFTGRSVVALPALYPDVAFIHVHECDCYGNARIRGITAGDPDMARAAKRLIITTERLVANREIRSAPNQTVIPSFCVDAVCEVPWGSYPGNMAGEYFSDEEHLAAWLEAEKTEEGFESFLQDHIYGAACFEEYLRKCGGSERLARLREMELFSREEPTHA